MDIKKAFQTYYVSALKRYADFKTRTSRKAYWMFVLFNMLISWLAVAIDNILGTEEVGRMTFFGIYNGMFNNFYGLIMMIPGIAIAVRRLHDVGRKGTDFFMILIPIYGWIWMIIELVKEGDAHENEYGPVPTDGADPEGYPYAPSGENNDNNFDVVSLRKEAEDIAKKKEKQSKTHTAQKKKNKKKFSLQDRRAVDFTYHSKEKRKT